jgi:hypothetical protein
MFWLGRCLLFIFDYIFFTGLMNSAAQQIMSKVYELRTYKIYPQYYKQFLSLTQEHLHLRTAHSKLLGYWTSELGGLNEIFHIWEYGYPYFVLHPSYNFI